MQNRAGQIAHRLLRWYDAARRDLPWRAPPGEQAEAYHVWLSEMMLQQTTVKAVAPYYLDFLRRWPRVAELARAPLDDVLAAWAGLGYYARARNMHKAAKIVAGELGGVFPHTAPELQKLPGIGPYTAAAIAAIAFDQPATVVDGNVERVIARLFAVREPLPGAKPRLRALAETLTPQRRPGDFAQAMMDLGSVICVPRMPACSRCPLAGNCRARVAGIAAALPARAPKAERATRRGAAFVAQRADGAVLLRRRPENGLLGGMMEPPTTGWRAESWPHFEAVAVAPLEADWRRAPAPVSHTFTHFHLTLDVYTARLLPARTPAPDPCRWVAVDDLPGAALPSVMRKVLAAVLD